MEAQQANVLTWTRQEGQFSLNSQDVDFQVFGEKTITTWIRISKAIGDRKHLNNCGASRVTLPDL
jgi:hypothetical protein